MSEVRSVECEDRGVPYVHPRAVLERASVR